MLPLIEGFFGSFVIFELIATQRAWARNMRKGILISEHFRDEKSVDKWIPDDENVCIARILMQELMQKRMCTLLGVYHTLIALMVCAVAFGLDKETREDFTMLRCYEISLLELFFPKMTTNFCVFLPEFAIYDKVKLFMLQCFYD